MARRPTLGRTDAPALGVNVRSSSTHDGGAEMKEVGIGVVAEVDVEGFDGARTGMGTGTGTGVAGARGAVRGTKVKLEALLPAASGGEVGGESAPPGVPGAARKAGCSTSAYRHTGHVPLVFSHVTIQSSWNAW